MAKSTGLGLIEASILDSLDPEFVVIVDDRFEMMSVVCSCIRILKLLIQWGRGYWSGGLTFACDNQVFTFALSSQ